MVSIGIEVGDTAFAICIHILVHSIWITRSARCGSKGWFSPIIKAIPLFM
jgi:hypothetical protein